MILQQLGMRSVPVGVGAVVKLTTLPTGRVVSEQTVLKDAEVTASINYGRYDVSADRQYLRSLDIPISSIEVNPNDLVLVSGVTYEAKRTISNTLVSFLGASGTRYYGRFDVAATPTPSTLDGWATGTLAKAVSDPVIAFANAAGAFSSAKQAVYTTQDHTNNTYVRNPSVWAPYDLSGCSPYNSRDGARRAGTLITRRHMINAAHYPLYTGDTVRFISPTNVSVTRTVTGTRTMTGSDILIVTLDADVPADIATYKVLPYNWSSFFGNLNFGIPCLCLDQEEKVLSTSLNSRSYLSVGHSTFSQSIYNTLALWRETLISGDSGNPLFLPLAGELILVTTHYTAFSGPDVASYLTEIDNYLSEAGDYSVSVVDLGAFPSY